MGENRNSPIPQVEIGSFIAPQADESEFIGSASGVFFVNTVYRAFATSVPPQATDPAAAEPKVPDIGIAVGIDGASNPDRDPGSAHNCLVVTDNDNENDSTQNSGTDLGALSSAGIDANSNVSRSRGYGISAPELGCAPNPTLAGKLVMAFFRHWHPFFPFLHGPSFYAEVDRFFDDGHHTATAASGPQLDQRAKTCQAVLFQCVFNLASSSLSPSESLSASAKIKSTLALTAHLGIVSSASSISAMQSMIAMELYLITRMSLRAASTVHGALTRMLYHAGFHRCPHRYVQLPRNICEIRQRIFWCAYVLDRFLSQALGHPVSFDDDEIDTCIPGMTELHRPVMPPSQDSLPPHAGATENYRAHLPMDHLRTGSNPPSSSTPRSNAQDMGGVATSPAAQRSAYHHHNASIEGAGQYVLTYFSTYSRLLGEAQRLFHCSIHMRAISRDKVQDLTCRIHAWWNSLPLALQDDEESGVAGSSNPYRSFFVLLYQSLLIFINRPFLSLPTNRSDFRSCLQNAVSASREIIRKLRRDRSESILKVWPGVSSAVWMSGLIIAFATLLDLYPFTKANRELGHCVKLLDILSAGWASAKRCQLALGMLQDRLTARFDGGHASVLPPRPALWPQQPVSQFDHTEGNIDQYEQVSRATPGGLGKRKRQHGDEGHDRPSQGFEHERAATSGGVGSQAQGGHIWQPILEYMGPDFGFDSDPFNPQDEWQNTPSQGLTLDSAGLYSTSMWDAYVQGVGDHLNF